MIPPDLPRCECCGNYLKKQDADAPDGYDLGPEPDDDEYVLGYRYVRAHWAKVSRSKPFYVDPEEL